MTTPKEKITRYLRRQLINQALERMNEQQEDADLELRFLNAKKKLRATNEAIAAERNPPRAAVPRAAAPQPRGASEGGPERRTPTVRLGQSSTAKLKMSNDRSTKVGPFTIVQCDVNEYPLRGDTIADMIRAAQQLRAKHPFGKVREVALQFRSSQEHRSTNAVVVQGDFNEKILREKLQAFFDRAFASTSAGTWELIHVELSI